MDTSKRLLKEVLSADLLPGKEGFESFATRLSGAQYLSMYREFAALDLPAKSAVLDWGCGDGHFSYALLKLGMRVTGYKFHGTCNMGPLLRESGGDLVEADLNEAVRLPFQDGSFDCVCSIGVLEHVREFEGDEIKSLREIHSKLSPNGLFFCCHFPNRGSLVEFIIRNLFPTRYHHKFLYSRKEIETLLGKTGFKLERISRYGVLPKNIFKNALGGLPDKGWFVSLYFGIDRVMERIFPALAQNWFFVARKT